MSIGEEQLRLDLRAIGLTRLARSEDLPKYVPNINHPIYAGDYRYRYGDQPLSTVPRELFGHDPIIYSDGCRLLENIFNHLVRQGEKLRDIARIAFKIGQVHLYLQLVEDCLYIIDTDISRVWGEGMDRELLVAYWLKVKEIEKRWPKDVVAEGLSGLGLGNDGK